MKTIGILGGIGPQATMAFEARLHRAAQRLVPPKYNEGYPPMVTVYLRHAPVLVERGRPIAPLTLDPRMLDAARRLGEWAELIVIPSNTPHLFVDELEQASGARIVSIAEVTAAELARRAARRVGLIGLGVPAIYVERFANDGIEAVTAPEPLRERLDDAILRLMEGRETDAHRGAAREALAAVREDGAAVTVLGCTEIPLLLGDDADAPDLVDPAALLAEAAIRAAIEA